ncbi:YbaB/EbfC family nucleoid-associated protein [Savagea faecisuis]|uniref:Nucleoid-associated protein ACFQ0V_00020 n=1 Tax=Savagea faecisuis TaxID=1274803 RepID=A0ABW3GTH1_9BACL
MRGMGNMQGMMKQMQKMQKKMTEAQEKLGEERIVGEAGNGMVKVTVSGHREVLDIEIDPELADPEDVEMLQDIIIIATNDALKKAEQLSESTMGQFTKGLNLPGMF